MDPFKELIEKFHDGMTNQEALALSIEKQEIKKQLLNDGKLKESYDGRVDCALCFLYNNDNTSTFEFCIGCIISEDTGQSGCNGSPVFVRGDIPTTEQVQGTIDYLNSLRTEETGL